MLRQINIRSYLELSFESSVPLPPSSVDMGFLNGVIMQFVIRGNISLTLGGVRMARLRTDVVPNGTNPIDVNIPVITDVQDEGVIASFTAMDELVATRRPSSDTSDWYYDYYTYNENQGSIFNSQKVSNGFLKNAYLSVPNFMSEKLIEIYKDPSEVLSMTFQLLNIIHPNHGDEIFFRNKALFSDKNLNIYICDEFYTKEDTVVKGVTRTLDTGISYSTVNKFIEIPVSYNTDKSWAIGDEDGNLILTVNQLDPNNPKSIVYFKTTDMRTLAK